MCAMRQKNKDELCALRQKSESDLHALRQENNEMKKRLFGEKVEKTKVITLSDRSKANTHDPEKEDERCHHNGEISTMEER